MEYRILGPLEVPLEGRQIPLVAAARLFNGAGASELALDPAAPPG